MDVVLIWPQIIAQWLTLDADVGDLVGVVATEEGDADVAVVAAARTRRRNGTKIAMNPTGPRILISTIEGLPLQNLVVL
jgi:hypothetical protein